ncbi:uncharacterized protein LOC123682603 [Harmonia axyridis]|uniref:uncharacterized protein LOC123682603 n=1 Tax=Harmonia axyridis TaxID=115357 RepID=UPI001E277A02|nr:uncharacterized protein LOC123682603 [Harmonia axyridis]
MECLKLYLSLKLLTMELFRVSSVLLSIFVVSAYSATWYDPPNTRRLTDAPGVCFESQYNIEFMKWGETRTPEGHCLLISCSDDGSITYNGCPAVAGCKDVKADFSKPYPDCCPTCDIPIEM